MLIAKIVLNVGCGLILLLIVFLKIKKMRKKNNDPAKEE